MEMIDNRFSLRGFITHPLCVGWFLNNLELSSSHITRFYHDVVYQIHYNSNTCFTVEMRLAQYGVPFNTYRKHHYT